MVRNSIDVAHELRNHLQAIQASFTAFRLVTRDRPDLELFIGIVERQLRGLAQLADKISENDSAKS